MFNILGKSIDARNEKEALQKWREKYANEIKEIKTGNSKYKVEKFQREMFNCKNNVKIPFEYLIENKSEFKVKYHK